MQSPVEGQNDLVKKEVRKEGRKGWFFNICALTYHTVRPYLVATKDCTEDIWYSVDHIAGIPTSYKLGYSCSQLDWWSHP